MKAGWLGLLIGSALLLAGCGGSQHTGRGSGSSTSTSETDGQLDALASGWKTDFGRHTVPLSAFQGGGPGKDGIPALDHPRFGRVAAIDFLKPQEPVIELVVKGDARAYPLQILIWHEIADDRVGGVPVAVTFCPLCNTAIVFDRRVRGRTLSFGTTGNLRNSDLVMYDRQTESWWQQFGGQASSADTPGGVCGRCPHASLPGEPSAPSIRTASCSRGTQDTRARTARIPMPATTTSRVRRSSRLRTATTAVCCRRNGSSSSTGATRRLRFPSRHSRRSAVSR